MNKYVLVTAAKNEEAYIELPLKSVINQTVLPKIWVIVSDGSTDETDNIVKRYAANYEFIKYIRVDGNDSSCGFTSKVNAFMRGYNLLTDEEYQFIGNLDADISFGEEYYEKVLDEFKNDERLGICGGYIFDAKNKQFENRSSNNIEYVSGAIQLFCRNCFEGIDGYVPVSVGGEDTIAVFKAQMQGWRVKALPDIKVFHHKNSFNIRGALKESWRDGAMDYALGSNPLYQIIKSIRRIVQKPYFLSAILRMAGYTYNFCINTNRPVDKNFIKFIRSVQNNKIYQIFKLNIPMLIARIVVNKAM